MFTRQPWLVLHTETHKDIFVSKPHSSIIRADVTLVNHLWTHMMFIYRPSSLLSFLLQPSFLKWHHFFHTLQMERVWVHVWCQLRLKRNWISFLLFVCFLREAQQHSGLPARRSPRGVWVFLTWLLSSTNKQPRLIGGSKRPLGVSVRGFRVFEVGVEPSTQVTSPVFLFIHIFADKRVFSIIKTIQMIIYWVCKLQPLVWTQQKAGYFPHDPAVHAASFNLWIPKSLIQIIMKPDAWVVQSV